MQKTREHFKKIKNKNAKNLRNVAINVVGKKEEGDGIYLDNERDSAKQAPK